LEHLGLPLSPILADIVMQDLELQAIEELNIRFPFYYRYIDDIVLLTPDNMVNDILDTFNSIHNRLQFTLEIEKNRTLNFLDLSLIVSDGIMTLDWYKKDICSGRFLSYILGHPLCHNRYYLWIGGQSDTFITPNFSSKKFGTCDKSTNG